MQFWQSLIFTESDQLLDLAQIAEENSFTGVVLPDHVALPERSDSSYPYSDYELDPTAPFLDPWPAIAAMATVTTRLRFSTYVYVLPMRDPFSVAKSLATTAILSQGRVALGLGVGWLREEFEILGHRFADRGARSDEMIEVMRQLWREGSAEYHGKYLDFSKLHAQPQPTHPIPIYVGGHTQAAIQRAARCDDWMGLDFDVEDVPALIERIGRARRSAGREAEPFEIFLSPRGEPEADTYRRLEQMGVTAVILPSWPLQHAGTYPVEGGFHEHRQGLRVGLEARKHTQYGGGSLDAKRRQMERFAAEFI